MRRLLILCMVASVISVLTAANAGAASPGYWLGADDSGVFSFNAPFLGPLSQPSPTVTGVSWCATGCSIASWPDSPGFWQLVTVFAECSYVPYPGASVCGSSTTASIDGLGVASFKPPPTQQEGSATPVRDASGNVIRPVPSSLRWNMAAAGQGGGVWVVASNGDLYPQFGAPNYGSMTALPPNVSLVGIASTSDGQGYWEVASDGGVFAFGDARFYGSMGGARLNQPVVGIAPTNDGDGYWLGASDGGVFAFGDARFYGSMGGSALNAPMVAVAANPDGTGYWTVAADGGVFAFGDAPFLGSLAGMKLNAPITSIATTP